MRIVVAKLKKSAPQTGSAALSTVGPWAAVLGTWPVEGCTAQANRKSMLECSTFHYSSEQGWQDFAFALNSCFVLAAMQASCQHTRHICQLQITFSPRYAAGLLPGTFNVRSVRGSISGQKRRCPRMRAAEDEQAQRMQEMAQQMQQNPEVIRRRDPSEETVHQWPAVL